MKLISDYLDQAKAITGSDYRTAQLINVTRAAISDARKRGTICNNNAVKLAALIGINPAEIIAASDVKTNPENALQWQKWVAASLFVGMVTFSENTFISSASAEIVNANSLYYVKCLMWVCLIACAAKRIKWQQGFIRC